MEKLPAGVPLSFEVSFDSPDLVVGITVLDDSGDDPVIVTPTYRMPNVYGNTYRGKFTAEAKNYVVNKAVYADDTFTAFDENYNQGSESFIAQYENNPGEACAVIGIVEETEDAIGVVEC